MKNIYEVLRQKELELLRLQKEVFAFYRVIPLIAEESDPKPDIPDLNAPIQRPAAASPTESAS